MPDARTPANDPVADARVRLADTLEEHPEMAAYTRPASEGSVRDVLTKLDEIAELLRAVVADQSAKDSALKAMMGRFVASRST